MTFQEEEVAIIVDKEKKRKEIVRAARTVFRKQGFHSCNMADIARTAGVGKGTIYEYFSSKEELFEEVFTDVFDVLARYMLRTIDSERRPVKKIRSFFKNMAIFYDEFQDEISLMFEFWSALTKPGEKPINLRVGNYYRKLIDHFERIFDEGKARGTIRAEISSRAAAIMILTQADGIAFRLFYGPEKTSVEEIMGEFAEIIFNGILTDEGRKLEGGRQ